MARIHKLVKSYGSKTISTSNQTLDKQTIKPLGDVVSWQLYMSLTTTSSTGTWDSSTGTPAGTLGSNILDLINQLKIVDNGNTSIFDASREEIYFQAYLLSSIENDEFIFNKGGVRVPTVDSAAVTAAEYVFNVPQRIALAHLPATLDITLGVLGDYFNSVGDGAATLNQISFYVRYVPADQSSFTERCKSFQLASTIATKTDIAFQLPEAIEILRLAITVDNLAIAGNDATNDILTRLTDVTFKRGSNDEIDAIQTEVLVEFNNGLQPNLRRAGDMASYAVSTLAADAPLGLVVIPTLAFVKSQSTEFVLNVSGTIQPVIFYIYK